jgi:hypothetical protein
MPLPQRTARRGSVRAANAIRPRLTAEARPKTMRPARPRRSSGSPPVKRTSVIPSRYTAIRRAISPPVSSAGLMQ